MYSIAAVAIIPLMGSSTPADTNRFNSIDEKVTTNTLAYTSAPTNILTEVTSAAYTNDIPGSNISTNLLESTPKEETGLITTPPVYNYLMRFGLNQLQKTVDPDSDGSIADQLPQQPVDRFKVSADLKYDLETQELDSWEYIGLKFIIPF